MMLALWAASLSAQDRDSTVLSFPGSVSLVIQSTWPSSTDRRIINTRVSLSIRSDSAYPMVEACFSWDSTTISRDTVSIAIYGRRRCPEGRLAWYFDGYDGEGLPTLDVVVSAPRAIRLQLPRAKGIVAIVSTNPVGHGRAYKATVIAPVGGITAPKLAIGQISVGSGHVRCAGAGYPVAVCTGFVESLAWLAGFALERPMGYWREGVLPPYHHPFELPDTTQFAREVIVGDLSPEILARLLVVAGDFTRLYRRTRLGSAMIQVTTAANRRFFCEDGTCREANMEKVISEMP